jgi:uncharacterized protein YndB with AHSA1/START domain
MNGITREIEGGHELQFERYLKHPVEQVWAAITTPEGLVGWLAEASVEPRLGGQVALRWLNTREPGQEILARGTVTAWEVPRLVEYETDIHGRLRFELRPEGEGCLLLFTCTISLPADHLLKHVAGWHIHLDHLAEALAGNPVEWPAWWTVHYPRWQKIHDLYVGLQG